MIPFRSTVIVGIRAFVYVALGFGALAVGVPALIANPVPGPLFFLGLPILFAGLAIYIWTIWAFVSVGHGTPLPLDPPRTLVVHGLYRVVRNPMALGFCLIFIGEAVAFDALQILAYAAILFLVIHVFIVFIEEPGLKRRFGESYKAYCQAVPRWLPRLSALRRSIRDVRRPLRKATPKGGDPDD